MKSKNFWRIPLRMPARLPDRRTKLYELINNGTLRTVLVGRKRLVNADSLRALVEGIDHAAG